MTNDRNVPCGRCLRTIDDPEDAKEKYFLVKKTGEVLALHRHAACTLTGGENLVRVEKADLKLLLSPASAMRNMLRHRRSRPVPKSVAPVIDFRKLNPKAKAQ